MSDMNSNEARETLAEFFNRRRGKTVGWRFIDLEEYGPPAIAGPFNTTVVDLAHWPQHPTALDHLESVRKGMRGELGTHDVTLGEPKMPQLAKGVVSDSIAAGVEALRAVMGDLKFKHVPETPSAEISAAPDGFVYPPGWTLVGVGYLNEVVAEKEAALTRAVDAEAELGIAKIARNILAAENEELRGQIRHLRDLLGNRPLTAAAVIDDPSAALLRAVRPR